MRLFPSPAEIQAVMATEENSSRSIRAGLLGQAEPEERLEMQQKSSQRELVMSVCPITMKFNAADDKWRQNNEQKQVSSLCLRRQTFTEN